MNSFKDISGKPKSPYSFLNDETRDCLRDESPKVTEFQYSRGCNAPPGQTGKPSTGRSGTGDGISGSTRYARCE